MNRLVHLAAFKKVLANYQISPASQRILAKTNLVLLVAPTSAGRNTIIRELLKTGDYHYIVSDTTRQPRANDGVLEQNGVEYWFRSEEEMLRDLKAGRFLEAAIIHNQQVSGISVRELKRAHSEGKIAITDIEIVGARHIVAAKPDTVAIFVLPPDLKEWMRRFKHRGKLSKAEMRRRLESAAKEFSEALEHKYYTFVVNDSFLKATEKIHQIAKLGIRDPEEEKRGRAVAEKLYLDTISYLKHTIING